MIRTKQHFRPLSFKPRMKTTWEKCEEEEELENNPNIQQFIIQPILPVVNITWEKGEQMTEVELKSLEPYLAPIDYTEMTQADTEEITEKDFVKQKSFLMPPDSNEDTKGEIEELWEELNEINNLNPILVSKDYIQVPNTET
ncbi:uncharacterized protein O3C94_021961 [Discoglossus pictus]